MQATRAALWFLKRHSHSQQAESTLHVPDLSKFHSRFPSLYTHPDARHNSRRLSSIVIASKSIYSCRLRRVSRNALSVITTLPGPILFIASINPRISASGILARNTCCPKALARECHRARHLSLKNPFTRPLSFLTCGTISLHPQRHGSRPCTACMSFFIAPGISGRPLSPGASPIRNGTLLSSRRVYPSISRIYSGKNTPNVGLCRNASGTAGPYNTFYSPGKDRPYSPPYGIFEIPIA